MILSYLSWRRSLYPKLFSENDTTMLEYKTKLEEVVAVVRKVAEFQLGYFRAMPEGATDMKAQRETVSFVDVESERILSEGLIGLVEGAGFYGEESGKQGSQELVWIVDPLDGTTNFLNGLDHFSISVALVEQGEPILGVVFKPFSGECYSAVKGEGVFYNGEKRTLLNPDPEVSSALFMTGFPYRSPEVTDEFFTTAASVLTLGRGIRRSGSAALDVANLSMGWLQGFWETDLQPYDIAAGLLMLSENGVVVTNGVGEKYDMFTDKLLVAGTPAVHTALLKCVKQGYRMN